MTPPVAEWSHGDLTIRARRGRADIHFRDGRPRLDGRRGWIVRGTSSAIDHLLAGASSVAERLTDDVALLRFGNGVGLVELPHLGTVEVTSGKWGQRAFDAMMRDLVSHSAELPFQAASTGALPYRRVTSRQRRILYHCFAYLRHVLSDAAEPEEQMHRAFRVVLRTPHREWRRTRRTVPVGRARRIDGKSLKSLVGGSGEYVDVQSAVARDNVVARALGGRLPSTVDERHDRSKVDTPENRFLRTFLDQVRRIIDDMEDVARSSESTLLQNRVQADCERLRRVLRPVLRHSLWSEVGEMTSVPSSSTVLQRRRGYRELYRHYARLRMASELPLDEEGWRDLLEIKDIALLYEVWAFLQMSSHVEKVLGSPSKAITVERTKLEARLRRSTDIEWPSGARLVYNPSFSRSRPSARHSYSVPLRPDILLEIPDGPNAGAHLFDAKFRLRNLRDAIPDLEEAAAEVEVEQAERRGTFKRGDLYKMHTYRDAIPNVNSVWILYPGAMARFFSTSGEVWDVGAGPVRALLNGVGALPLRPASHPSEPIRRVVEQMLIGVSSQATDEETCEP